MIEPLITLMHRGFVLELSAHRYSSSRTIFRFKSEEPTEKELTADADAFLSLTDLKIMLEDQRLFGEKPWRVSSRGLGVQVKIFVLYDDGQRMYNDNDVFQTGLDGVLTKTIFNRLYTPSDILNLFPSKRLKHLLS
jgi:hypothetical protein